MNDGADHLRWVMLSVLAYGSTASLSRLLGRGGTGGAFLEPFVYSLEAVWGW